MWANRINWLIPNRKGTSARDALSRCRASDRGTPFPPGGEPSVLSLPLASKNPGSHAAAARGRAFPRRACHPELATLPELHTLPPDPCRRRLHPLQARALPAPPVSSPEKAAVPGKLRMERELFQALSANQRVLADITGTPQHRVDELTLAHSSTSWSVT